MNMLEQNDPSEYESHALELEYEAHVLKEEIYDLIGHDRHTRVVFKSLAETLIEKYMHFGPESTRRSFLFLMDIFYEDVEKENLKQKKLEKKRQKALKMKQEDQKTLLS